MDGCQSIRLLQLSATEKRPKIGRNARRVIQSGFYSFAQRANEGNPINVRPWCQSIRLLQLGATLKRKELRANVLSCQSIRLLQPSATWSASLCPTSCRPCQSIRLLQLSATLDDDWADAIPAVSVNQVVTA